MTLSPRSPRRHPPTTPPLSPWTLIHATWITSICPPSFGRPPALPSRGRRHILSGVPVPSHSSPTSHSPTPQHGTFRSTARYTMPKGCLLRVLSVIPILPRPRTGAELHSQLHPGCRSPCLNWNTSTRPGLLICPHWSQLVDRS